MSVEGIASQSSVVVATWHAWPKRHNSRGSCSFYPR